MATTTGSSGVVKVATSGGSVAVVLMVLLTLLKIALWVILRVATRQG